MLEGFLMGLHEHTHQASYVGILCIPQFKERISYFFL